MIKYFYDLSSSIYFIELMHLGSTIYKKERLFKYMVDLITLKPIKSDVHTFRVALSHQLRVMIIVHNVKQNTFKFL